MATSNEELVEKLGMIVETCMNYTEYGTHSTTGAFAQLPAGMRIDALSNGLKEAQDNVRKLYFDLGGEDVWDAS